MKLEFIKIRTSLLPHPKKDVDNVGGRLTWKKPHRTL